MVRGGHGVGAGSGGGVGTFHSNGSPFIREIAYCAGRDLAKSLAIERQS